MSFKTNKYSVLKNAISKELAEFVYKYFYNKRNVAQFLFDQKYISPFTEYWGIWADHQAPNTYSHYSDIAMETLLQEVKPVMEKHTKLKLSETYSYARLYKKGDVLARHKDRYSCEISTTMNLGGTLWPIYLEGKAVKLNPGDMLVYKGCELEHWRDQLKKGECAQVFLHYNKNTKKAVKFAGRAALGVPSYGKDYS